jgi:hypothetical protein
MLTILAALLLRIGQEPVPSDVKQAIAALATSPDDQKAATTAGRWYAQTGDWEKATPLLLRGSDEALRKLSEREAAAAENAFELVEIGDEWLKLSAKTQKVRASYRARAGYWYGRGWEKLADPVWRMKLREKLLALSGISEAPVRQAQTPIWWNLFEAGKTATVDGAVGHGGTRSLRVWNAPDDMTRKPGATSPPMMTKGGTTYKISAWVLSDGGDSPGEIRLRFWDSSGKFLGQPGALVPPNAPYWQEVRAEVKAPDGAAKMDLQVIVISKDCRTWVDDVSVKVDDRELVQNGGFEK